MIDPAVTAPAQTGSEFLSWAVLFFALAIVAALVGARGVAGVSMEVARVFVVIFVVLAIVAILL